MKTKIELTCPKCGAHLSVEPSREILFCEYCGTKILLNDENTFTIRKIDEAKIKQAEADQLVQLKKLELEQKKAENDLKKLKLKIIISLILAVTGVILMVIGNLAGSGSNLFNLAFIGYFPLLGALFIWVADEKANEEKNKSKGGGNRLS